MIGEVFQSTRDGEVTVIGYEGSKKVTVKWSNTGNTSVVQLNALRNGLVRDKTLLVERRTAQVARGQKHAAKLAAAAIKRQQREAEQRERRAAAASRRELDRIASEAAIAKRWARTEAATVLRKAKALATCDLSSVEIDESKPRKGVLELDFKDRSGKWVLRFRNPVSKEFVQTRLGKLHNNVSQRSRAGGSAQEVYNTSYAGVGMSELFADAQSFCDWVVRQPGWGLGWQLDKDLLGGTDRRYSEVNCVFLPRRLNQAIANCNDSYGVRRLASAYRDVLDPSAYAALLCWEPR